MDISASTTVSKTTRVTLTEEEISQAVIEYVKSRTDVVDDANSQLSVSFDVGQILRGAEVTIKTVSTSASGRTS